MRRVVITGLGCVAPYGRGLEKFENALRAMTLGYHEQEILNGYKLKNKVAAIPTLSESEIVGFTDTYRLVKLRSSAILYGLMAGVDAWENAGLPIGAHTESDPLWRAGTIFGTSCAGVDAFCYNVDLARQKKSRKMGGRIAQQAMNSGISAYLGGILGLGNQVTTNSSEGNTGLEAILQSYYRIAFGKADIMLAGSTESSMTNIFSAYDLMKTQYGAPATLRKNPELYYSPLSNENNGFIVGAGSGALVLESLDSALARRATIYGEIVGAHLNSGGQRQGGNVMDINVDQLTNCISETIQMGALNGVNIDFVNGCLQSDYCDHKELEALSNAFEKNQTTVSYLESTKSLIGHCLSASGGLEMVASLLQLKNGFIHGTHRPLSIAPKDQDLLTQLICQMSDSSISAIPISNFLKVSFGVGDVNACIAVKKYIYES